MSFESFPQAPRINRTEITPLGPEVELAIAGNKIVIRYYKGKPEIASSTGPTNFDNLPPSAIRLVEEAFAKLKEPA